MKKLLQEDDCAPDAREYFIEEMKEEYNIDFSDFFKNGIQTEVDELCTQYRLNGFILEYNGDDPYYRLYREEGK